MGTAAPPASRREFDDPTDFADAVQNAHLRLMPQRAGQFRARVTQVRLPVANLSHTEENLPRVALIETAPGRIYVRPTLHDDPPRLMDGQAELPGTLRLRHEAAVGVEHTTTPSVLRVLSLPRDALQARMVVLLGRDLDALLRGPLRWRPAAAHFAGLVALHQEAIALARDAPHVLAHPAAAAALDARIAEVLLSAWCGATALPERAAQRRGDRVMARVLRCIEDAPMAPLSLTTLCETAGCSPKTLEVLFRDRLGQTPLRYLQQRRLWLAHRALLAADPRRDTVAGIAMDCGFWEVGRFAGAYRALFGQAPSATLQRKLSAPVDPASLTITA